jgi:hypothetical protein
LALSFLLEDEIKYVSLKPIINLTATDTIYGYEMKAHTVTTDGRKHTQAAHRKPVRTQLTALTVDTL